MSSMNRHCRTFLPLVLSLTAPLLAQKGGHEALDFEQILTKPGDFLPKPPRAGLLPGETKAVWRVMEVPGEIEVVDRYELQTRGTNASSTAVACARRSAQPVRASKKAAVSHRSSS
jgi:hypothetical protein